MTVNSARVAGGLNVYVFRADPKDYFGDFACGCSAVQPGDTIVCDAALLDYVRNILTEPESGPYHTEFLEAWTQARRELGIPAGPADRDTGLTAYENLALSYSQAMLRWTIGHEVGHVRLRHLDETGQPVERRESEADAFVVNTLAHEGTNTDLLYLALTLESMINTLYVDAIRQTHPEASPPSVGPVNPLVLPDITVAPHGDHPPLLLRVLSMWETLAKQPGYDYITDLAPTISRKVRTAARGAELTLCRSSPTTQLAHHLVILPEPAPTADYVDGLFAVGRTWADMTQYAQAERTFSQAVATAEHLTGPEHDRLLAEAHRWRGTIRYIRRHHHDAEADLERAVALDGNQTATHALLGWNQLALGDRDGAATSWHAALDRAPDLADAHAGLAILEADRGDQRRASVEYRAAVDHDPGYASDAWLRFSRFLPDDVIRRLAEIRAAAGT